MPTPITAEFSVVLLRDLEGLQREIGFFPDDDSVWTTRPGVANSAGNLALHIAGNIRYFIGHHLGGIDYVRDRDAEFGRRSGTRDELIAELGHAIAAVRDVLPRLTEERLDRLFEGHSGVLVSTRRFLLHLCTHTSFHLGQAGYLRRIVTGDSRSTNTVSASRLA
jgi:uncharacterized damage-inducible protein DinB